MKGKKRLSIHLFEEREIERESVWFVHSLTRIWDSCSFSSSCNLISVRCLQSLVASFLSLAKLEVDAFFEEEDDEDEGIIIFYLGREIAFQAGKESICPDERSGRYFMAQMTVWPSLAKPSQVKNCPSRDTSS